MEVGSAVDRKSQLEQSPDQLHCSNTTHVSVAALSYNSFRSLHRHPNRKPHKQRVYIHMYRSTEQQVPPWYRVVSLNSEKRKSKTIQFLTITRGKPITIVDETTHVTACSRFCVLAFQCAHNIQFTMLFPSMPAITPLQSYNQHLG